MTETERASVSNWAASRSHWWMGLMLITLHASLAWGIETWWARALMLAHFGFFLMWQPVWRAEREISTLSGLLIIGVGALLGFVANWWLAALWLGVLIGLIGGRAFGADSRRQHWSGLLALTYLLGLLLGWVVPQLFPDYQETAGMVILMRYVWLTLPVLLFFMPQARITASTHVVDFIYSVMLFLLVMVLVLGSFVLKLVTNGDYLFSVALTLFSLALMLLVLAWLWKPRAGFAGFGQLLSRYLLSVGLPFEQWIRNLAHLAETEREPQVFLAKALEEIIRLPWVAGGAWHTADDAGEFGELTPHRIEIKANRLMLELYTRGGVSPSLVVHVRLLTNLLEFFYEAKLREQQQRQNAYVQAIHETGARLTHDIKNMLQSLTALCSAAETSGADQAEALQMLIQRQLPLITRRLDQTLKKIKAPDKVGREEIAAADWWRDLRTRYEPNGVAFTLEGETGDCTVPAELFDSVADNLVQNAIKKRGAEMGVTIRVSFQPVEGGTLRVEDSGSPLLADTAAKLFDAPVASKSGLGIGLYQAARQAEQLGYRLSLDGNETGHVCFELSVAQGKPGAT